MPRRLIMDDLLLLRILAVWALFNGGMFGVVDAQGPGAGRYYSGPGNSTGSCPISTCSYSACSAWQYLSGCTFNSSGTCTNCTLPAVTPGYYYSATGELSNNCVLSACLTCPPGQMNVGCGPGNQGSCVSCAASLTPGNYWVSNTPTVQCNQTQQTVCPPGYYTTGATSTLPGGCTACSTVMSLPAYNYWTTPLTSLYTCSYTSQTTCPTGQVNSIVTTPSSTSTGSCSNCPATAWGYYYVPNTNPGSNCPTAVCRGDCPVGQYNSNCGGTSSGSCVNCTTATGNQVYSTGGNLTNTCQVVGCTLACSAGQYISGCGGPQSGMSCQPCTNSIPNVNYYTGMGAYNSTSCNTASCPVCNNGFYNAGCGGTSMGSCSYCTNS